MFSNLNNVQTIIEILVIIVPIIVASFAWLHTTYTKVSNTLKKVDQIIIQLQPNGGSSIKDSLDRIEHRVSVVDFSQRIYWDMVSETPMFTTNEHGKCTWVNKSYINLVKRPIEDVLDTGWEIVIYQEDRNKVREEWYRACDEHRPFDLTYRIIDINETVYRIRCRAYGSEKTGYVGFLTKIEENFPKG